MVLQCVSCGKNVEAEANWVEFPCPKCAKTRIVRCGRCKLLENPYTCACGFSGP